MYSLPDSPVRVRAARYPLRVPVRFRPSGSAKWYRGRTDNISCSGVLFRCRQRMEPHAPVEVMLNLPSEGANQAPLAVVFGGYIARVSDAPEHGKQLGLAAAFVDFRFVREEGGPQESGGAREPGRQRPAVSSQAIHALNNQLTVIMGHCELLLAGKDLPQDVRDGLLRIRNAGDQMAEIVRKLRAA